MRLPVLYFFLCFLCFLSFKSFSQVSGCTDPLALNYNSNATINNGSCMYNAFTVTPIVSHTLSNSLNETSGLIFWNNNLYTHNDNTDLKIYQLDSINGAITNSYSLQSITNIDWEEISQDSFYVYLGDFGNNANGNRTNLRIYRIDKSSLLNNTPLIDTINFVYSNQTTYTATGSNNTDFDCEAFVVTNDSIFLFTKQWLSQKTSLYALPKTAGTYTANYRSTLDVQGLITGATLIEDKKLLALCGYNTVLQPFFYLLYDYSDDNFFNGNKRKVSMALPFHQTEGIASKTGLKYYVSNEYFTQPPVVTVPQKLNVFDLSTYLVNYISPNTGVINHQMENKILVYPSVVESQLTIRLKNRVNNEFYTLKDVLGQEVLAGFLSAEQTTVALDNLKSGIYYLKIAAKELKVFKIIKN